MIWSQSRKIPGSYRGSIGAFHRLPEGEAEEHSRGMVGRAKPGDSWKDWVNRGITQSRAEEQANGG